MDKKKTALLLINVGTPDEPTVRAVRRYLTEFLNDRRVIDIPFIWQKILVNFIIVPFRSPKSTKLYKRLWTENGSPLLYYTKQLQTKLQEKIKSDAKVFIGMRYGNPSIKSALEKIQDEGFKRIVVLPMFPQYASSTSGTAIQAVFDIVNKWNTIPEMLVIDKFYDHPRFLDAFAERINEFNPAYYDHIIFTYHGLPNRHLEKNHPKESFKTCNCDKSMPEFGNSCYKASCYETTRGIVHRLKLNPDNYSVSFQSRLSNNWMTPFTDKNLIEKALNGKRKILVAAPSFVADCLETTVEIGFEYRELFIENGGEELKMADSLNDSHIWVDALSEIVEPYLRL